MRLPPSRMSLTAIQCPALSGAAEAVVTVLAGTCRAPEDEQLVRLRGMPPDEFVLQLADEVRGTGLFVSRVAFTAAADDRCTASCEACFVHVLAPEIFIGHLAAHSRAKVTLVTTF